MCDLYVLAVEAQLILFDRLHTRLALFVDDACAKLESMCLP